MKNSTNQWYKIVLAKNVQNNRKLPKRFQRTELFAFRGNFVM